MKTYVTKVQYMLFSPHKSSLLFTSSWSTLVSTFSKSDFFSPPPSLDTSLLMFRVPQSSPALHTWIILSIPLVSEGKYTEDSPFCDISPDLSPKLQTHLSSWLLDSIAPLHKWEAPQPERIFFLLYVAPSVLNDITGDSIAQKKTGFFLTHIYLVTSSYVFHLSLKSIYFFISTSLIQATITSHPESSFWQFLLTPYSPYNPLSTLTQEFFHKCKCHSFI